MRRESLEEKVRRFWTDALMPKGIVLNETGLTIARQRDERKPDISLLEMGTMHIFGMNAVHYADFHSYLAGREPDKALLLRYAAARGIAWNPPDLLFYRDAPLSPLQQKECAARRLDAADKADFEAFLAACPPEDRDAAYVELEHDMVMGVFAQGRLASAGSAFPFMKMQGLYDIGYLTRPDCQGRGYGFMCAQALTADIIALGAAAQIRVQPHRESSLRIARKLGFVPMGEWLYPVQAQSDL